MLGEGEEAEGGGRDDREDPVADLDGKNDGIDNVTASLEGKKYFDYHRFAFFGHGHLSFNQYLCYLAIFGT